MKCNQIFSLLQLTDSETATYTIQNIIVASDFEKASRIARAFYGKDALAIDTTLYAVGIGCTYVDGTFYDENGNVIERNQTEAEKIAALEAENAELKAQLAEQAEAQLLTDETAVELYEAQLIQEEVNIAQDEALVEIYELIENLL